MHKVKALFPEIELIQDAYLKDMVVEIWAEIWEKSCWRDVELDKVQYNQYISTQTLVKHTRAVARAMNTVIDDSLEFFGIEYNKDKAIAAALLHDACKLLEMYKDDEGNVKATKDGKMLPHGFTVAQIAYEKGLPTEMVHMLITHTPKSKMKPKTREGILLWYVDAQQADMLYSEEGLLLSFGGDRDKENCLE